MRLAPTALAGLVLALGVAPAAAAAPAWLEPFDISPAAQNVDDDVLAVNGAGHAVAAWDAPELGLDRIWVSTHAPGSGFSAAAPISEVTPLAAVQPHVALDPAGNAMAVWRRENGDDDFIQAAHRPAGGAWEPETQISEAAAGSARVAMDGAGNAIAVWIRSDGANFVIEYIERAADGTFSAVEPLSVSGANALSPALALNAAGDAIVVWNRGGIVQARRRAAGEPAFGAVQDLSANTAVANNPRAALDPAGNAVVVWSQTEAMVQTARWAAAAPGELFGPGTGFGSATMDAHVATDGAGAATAVWRHNLGGDQGVIEAATRPPGGAFGTSVPLSPESGQDAFAPALAVSPTGAAAVIWTAISDAGQTTEGTLRPAGGAFADDETLSAAGVKAADQRVGIDDAGNVLALWQGFTDRWHVQARIYDATAPELRDLDVPATGTAGVPVTFAASPFDAWSAPSPVAWDFGDGGTGAGNTTAHTYATPGTYTVGASTTDAAGTATAATRQIQIAPGAASAPPVLSRLRLSRKRFRAARRGGSIARVRRRTKVSYRLDRAALVAFAAQRRRPGRPRWKTVRGSFVNESLAGRNRFTFSGRVGGRRLRPGRYRLVATPRVNALVGKAVRARFRIVR